MKFSQKFTRQEFIPSNVELNWFDNGNHLWLRIDSGVLLTKQPDGVISIMINNMPGRGLGSFTGQLFNTTNHKTISINLLTHDTFVLDPKCHYILVLNNIDTTITGNNFNINTIILDFEPE